MISLCSCSKHGWRICPTNNQTLHLILPHYFHTKSLLDAIIVLVRASSRGHDTQIILRATAIALHVLLLQPLHKLDAHLDLVRFELEEVQPPTFFVAWF